MGAAPHAASRRPIRRWLRRVEFATQPGCRLSISHGPIVHQSHSRTKSQTSPSALAAATSTEILEPRERGERRYARSRGGNTNTSIKTQRPYLTHALGALGGAAVGVLINVYAGVPRGWGGPLAVPAVAAVAGAVAVQWLPAKALESPLWRMVGIAVLGIVMALAAVYTIAALALSNFE